MKVLVVDVTDIRWDLSDEDGWHYDADVPDSVTGLEICLSDDEAVENNDAEIEDDILNTLSDEYGWLVEGMSWEIKEIRDED